MPWIERVEVEDGFLDGLDLHLSKGLNVVIGARGTGKTSLLELIRFVLGAPAFTEQAAALSSAQVKAILNRGRVSVTIRHDDGSVATMSRAIGSAVADPVPATVLAQNEIEAVGASSRGRLHLVDRFLDQSQPEELLRLQTEIAAIGKVVDSGVVEVDSLRERISEIAEVEQELDVLRVAQEAAFERASASAADRTRLGELQAGLQKSGLRLQLIAQVSEAIGGLREDISSDTASSTLPRWPDEAGPDPTLAARSAYADALVALSSVGEQLGQASTVLQTAVDAESTDRSAAEDEARELRRQLGAMDAEVSSLSNRIAELNERLGHLRGLEELMGDRRAKALDATAKRDALFEALDDQRESRSRSRSGVVARLNQHLRPAIQVDLVQSADTDDYTNEIIGRLRGSGLHSRTLAPILAKSLSPLDLLRAIEAGSVDEVASLTGVAPSRIEAAFSRLRESSPSGLAAVSIDDSVDLFLLDGASLKPSGELSIGQRCTVVLPILLQRHGDILVIDQPEDHLDNAFVTSTLVETLRQRESGDQVILASHNANVPVLGEADLVVHMSSDGKRGFVSHSGPLDDRDTVQAVTDVMEGGAVAFRRRATFYEQHGHADQQQ